MMFTACLPQHSQNPTRTNRSSGLTRKSYLLNKQMIIDNSCLGLANTQDERFTPFLVINIKWLLTFGLGIVILQGVSRSKYLAGVYTMLLFGNLFFCVNILQHLFSNLRYNMLNVSGQATFLTAIFGKIAFKYKKQLKYLWNFTSKAGQWQTNTSPDHHQAPANVPIPKHF
jgi:hypothetical protein